MAGEIQVPMSNPTRSGQERFYSQVNLCCGRFRPRRDGLDWAWRDAVQGSQSLTNRCMGFSACCSGFFGGIVINRPTSLFEGQNMYFWYSK
jgi:hypothetical protein